MPPSAELNAGPPGPTGPGRPGPGPGTADGPLAEVIPAGLAVAGVTVAGVTAADGAADRALARRNTAVIAGVTAGFAALLLLQSLLYGRLTSITEYDDGVHFGAALQLIHGVMPYRDFAFLQPPMVTVWLAPFAALAGLTGTAHAMVAARLFTDLIAVASVAFAGLLVRHRPTIQVAVTTGFMACYPATVAAAKTVMLEPMVVFWCLLALLVIFDRGRISRSGRRILLGGVLFGIAGATKTWAVLPLLALLAMPWSAGAPGTARPAAGARGRLPLIAGAAIGFAVCVLPFLIAAPSAFVNQVLVVQALRNGGGYAIPQRLADLTGLPGLFGLVTADRAAVIVPLALCAGVIALAWPALLRPALLRPALLRPSLLRPSLLRPSLLRPALLRPALLRSASARRDEARLARAAASDPIAWFGLVATGVTAFALLAAPTYFYHYAAFAAPFVALLLGSVACWWRERLAGRTGRIASLAAPVALIGVMAVARLSAILTAPAPAQVSGTFAASFPASGCVVSLSPSVPILAGRFTSAAPGCPRAIDWLGEERVRDHGLAQLPSDITSPAVQAMFMSWVTSARVIVIQQKPDWDPAVTAYVARHFRLVRAVSRPYPLSLYIRG